MVSRMSGEAVVMPTVTGGEKTVSEIDIPVIQVQVVSEQNQLLTDNEKPLPVEKAKQMTDSMNTFLESANTQLRFKFHEKLNEYYVTIVDSKTDEVVREIPSKKLMDIHAAMREFVGLLIDRKI